MSLQNRIDKLERAAGQNLCLTHDLTLLTDAELIALERWTSATVEGIAKSMPPELETALRRVKR
jgi:hypothetical protein